MKIPNREINIFNLSMLDVICGALGAFLIVTVVLFPSYQNKATVIADEIGKAKEANERLRQEIAKTRKAAESASRAQEITRENAELQAELDTLEKSLALKQQRSKAAQNEASRETSTSAPVRLTAANPSLSTVKNPPLLVWIAWRRPLFTKHFSTSLGLIPVDPSSKGTTEEDVKAQFMKGRLRSILQGAWIVHHNAPRERPHIVFDEGLEYTLVGNAKPSKWYVTYTVTERSEFVSSTAREPVTVQGFAVYGNQQIVLPKVSFVNQGSSVLVGSLSLEPKQGLHFDKIMERR